MYQFSFYTDPIARQTGHASVTSTSDGPLAKSRASLETNQTLPSSSCRL